MTRATVRHIHRIKSTRTQPYNGPVARRENPMAHGGIMEIDACWCGAERKTNVNGMHTERGEWTDAPDQDEHT